MSPPSAPPAPLSKRVRTIDEWNNLSEDEARKLSPADTLLWLHAYEVRKQQEDRRFSRKQAVSEWTKFIGQMVIGLPLGLSLLFLGGVMLVVPFKALTGEPIVFTKDTMELIRNAIFIVLITGPIARKFHLYLD